MDTTVNQTRVCGNVLLLILFCTLIFTSSAASTKADSEIEESLVSSRGRPDMFIGSRPPTCFSKCEKCTPCTPIIVPLPPVPTHIDSASKQSDIASQLSSHAKPEVWKCTCGGKLYDS
ncbi:hypothetical protein VIGAN_06186900 [Vigna angularis var. angularis]|uniref:Epidermal patterning factor-like protein n=1 Tax=Vigna angularis var. angularis TaxID=157739 RepID=A0A0S3SCT8_PHAAN|nr:hypothetical protein VIGAN_06186900 [Vigna angularis var. angularis]